jgi:class 3 adenylate cyclase
MTMFVLFADNIRLMTADKSVDDDFVIVNSVCLFAFIIEWFANTWSKSDNAHFIMYEMMDGLFFFPVFFCEGFAFSFFWWLDLVAILSMFPDIPWIADPLGIGGISSSYDASNAATKVGRVLRLVRLVRLIKLYKIFQIRSRKAKEEKELMEKVKSGQVSFEDITAARNAAIMASKMEKSKLGEQISDSITKRVVVLVLVMVCILPLLDVPTVNNAPSYGTEFLHTLNQESSSSVSDYVKNSLITSFFDNVKETLDGREYLLSLYMYPYSSSVLSPLTTDEYTDYIDDLRTEAKETYTHTTGTVVTTAVFSNKYLEYDYAMYSTITTLFIAVLLVLGSLIFTSDTQNMVIAPIERMMHMVEAVAKDPLKPISFDHDNNKAGSGEYETRLLESTIEKITGLLRVGFGEAGAGIISANLQTRKGGESGAVNPLLPGVRIYAIIGFCDIHHFEDINNNLADDVLTFVNTVAEIVHSRVHYWGGQVNKNLGNAFVILWRIGDEIDVQMQTAGNSQAAQSSMRSIKAGAKSAAAAGTPGKSKIVDLRRVPGVDKLADHALVSYLKIIAEINRDQKVLEYRDEPRLTNNGADEFKVRMGFGLHAGWAIEGAVGSIHKVDATYLSPHVNMAARLETSSRQYGVPILVSQNAYDLFSPDCQHMCRKCDVVTVKGSEVPIGIYTYDALQEQMFTPKFIQQVDEIEGETTELCPEELEARTEINERRRNAGLPMIPEDNFPVQNLDDWEDETEPNYEPTGALRTVNEDDWKFERNTVDSQDLFETDTDLVILRHHAADEEFNSTFKQGVNCYLDGDWPAAKELLTKADALMKVRVLLYYCSSFLSCLWYLSLSYPPMAPCLHSLTRHDV